MMTFGSRMSTNSPPRITMSSSFASFRDLISSATGLVRSSSSVSETATTTAMFAPFSPTTHLTRAQSTAYGGASGSGRHIINGVHSGSGGVSFSPGSRRKTAFVMMAPTIVVAEKSSSSEKVEKEKDRDASSMHTISSSPNSSASSSLTMISSSLEQQKEHEDRAEKEEIIGLEPQGSQYPEAKTPESNGHAAPGAGVSSPSRHVPSEQRPPTTTKQRHHSLLKVPEPAKAGSSNHRDHRRQHSPPTSVAASAMAAAQRAWLSSMGLTRGEQELIRSTSSSSMTMTSSMDSLTGPLTGHDYIGQFERERAKARGMMMTTARRVDPSVETEIPTTTASSSVTFATTEASAPDDEAHAGTRGDLKKKAAAKNETHHHKDRPAHPPPRPPPIHHRSNSSPTSHRHPKNGFRRSFLQTVRIRQESGPLDMSDKLMHLPEPSRFEGMCSCRGVINIASMLLILLGLVLLILGYPIATSLNKDRAAAEAAAGISATAPATAPGSDVLVAAASVPGPNLVASETSAGGLGGVVAERRSLLPAGVEGLTTMMDKRVRFAREGRSMDVVFSDEFRQKGRWALTS
ncbi:hypothetical protein BGZ72_005758 [Mortierella alpina]|nr:hypothetical protein BGZ72_005758 [Mortierella alpina]